MGEFTSIAYWLGYAVAGFLAWALTLAKFYNAFPEQYDTFARATAFSILEIDAIKTAKERSTLIRMAACFGLFGYFGLTGVALSFLVALEWPKAFLYRLPPDRGLASSQDFVEAHNRKVKDPAYRRAIVAQELGLADEIFAVQDEPLKQLFH